MGYELEPIAVIHTPYPEKFSVPRQPGLVTCDRSVVQLLGKYDREELIRGLDDFSHLWLIWVFDQISGNDWKSMVRPPRLGGNRKIGVLASRSPYRPNRIGLSVVKLTGIRRGDSGWCIDVSGVDLVDGTSILDIKPYLPYSDSVASAHAGYAEQSPQVVAVNFSRCAQQVMEAHRCSHPHLQQLIVEVLGQQPQPAYHTPQQRSYGTRLLEFNIRWRISSGACDVESIEARP